MKTEYNCNPARAGGTARRARSRVNGPAAIFTASRIRKGACEQPENKWSHHHPWTFTNLEESQVCSWLSRANGIPEGDRLIRRSSPGETALSRTRTCVAAASRQSLQRRRSRCPSTCTMFRLTLLIIALTYIPEPSPATTLADKLDQLYEKLEKLTVPPPSQSTIELTERFAGHYAKLEESNNLGPLEDLPEDGLTDDEEAILSGIEAWGGVSARQMIRLMKEIQEIRHEKTGDVLDKNYIQSGKFGEGLDDEASEDEDSHAVVYTSMDWFDPCSTKLSQNTGVK
ncbi:hypothetical protein EVAR_204_1 [Eumeta japonica]|uniref:Uncharacterized protein n=1 Tax=Eumeta variegata TaxID=151549 RepID=A0A4C1SC77_EUMVA|nr:hypothetical protein EVAR_204_1 [Eumeta japonica]